MRLDSFFDPHNPEHMKAYEHLCTAGVWPPDFLPEGIEIPMLWLQEIQAKMAQAWLHAMKNEQIIGKTMTKLYYTTSNGDITGKASYFYRTLDSAHKCMYAQNARAKAMGGITRYTIAENEGFNVGYVIKD